MANVSQNGNHTTFNQYYSCSNYLNVVPNSVITTLNVLIAITAFPGNFLIIVALQKITSLHPSSKLLLSCLASTDLCVGLILQPLYITYLLAPAHAELCYYIGYVAPILALIFCGVSLLTLTAISVDRLLALTLGMAYRRTVTLKRVWAFVIVSWIGSSAGAMGYIYDYDIPLYISCAGALICISVSTFCYVKIYRALHHHQSRVLDHIEPPTRREIPFNITRYKKTVSSTLWVWVVLVTCYLPFALLALTGYIANIYSPSFYLFLDLSITLVQLNSSLNPLLYCWKIKEARQAVKNTIKQFPCFWG